MARSAESVWLAFAGLGGAAAVGLVGVAAALDVARVHYSVWSSAPMVASYGLAAFTLVSVVGALREWPLPLAGGKTLLGRRHNLGADLEAGAHLERARSEPISSIDAYSLGVHRAIDPDPEINPRPTLDRGLTPYLQREHDVVLRNEIDRVLTTGCPAMMLLVGDSATGKTRALYEAIRSHRVVCCWPIFRPVNSAELNLLFDNGEIKSGSVLWLNEAQKFLLHADGQKASYGLLRLLEESESIVVVGAMWRTHYDELNAVGRSGDPTAASRELLDNPRTRRIAVPDRMTIEERRLLILLAGHDKRVTRAIAASQDQGQVVQHLTGGPDLVEAFLTRTHFKPVERALITAALDARRFGHQSALSGELLASAADGYLTAQERPGHSNWAVIALSEIITGVRANGTRTDVRATLTALSGVRSYSGQEQPAYEPAEFLDQNTRMKRSHDLGNARLWDALASRSATADDMQRVGRSAQRRGLYRHAALTWLEGTRLGNAASAASLIKIVVHIDPDQSSDVVTWIADRVSLDDLRGVTALIRAVTNFSPGNAADQIVHRAISTVELESGRDAAVLIELLHRAKADRALAAFAERAAKYSPLDSPRATRGLVNSLLKVQLDEAAATLALRAADEGPIDSLRGTAALIRSIHRRGLSEPTLMLAARAAEQAPLHGARAAAILIGVLQEVGAKQAIDVLLSRDPASHASLDGLSGVSLLIRKLSAIGATDAASHLAGRAASESRIGNANGITNLIQMMHQVGLSSHAEILEQRFTESLSGNDSVDTPGNSLSDILKIPWLPRVAVIAIFSDDPGNITYLTSLLSESTTPDQSRALADCIACNIPLSDLSKTARLLEILHRRNAAAAVTKLADRVSTGAPVEDPREAYRLMRALRLVDAKPWLRIFADRVASFVPLENARGIAELLLELHKTGLNDALLKLLGRDPASSVNVDMGRAVRIVKALRAVNADDAATRLLVRCITEGSADSEALFSQFAQATVPPRDAAHMARFGREPDGRPSRPWSWHDISQTLALPKAES